MDEPDAHLAFFTAVQEQLGLKLEPTKGLADVLVIDHVVHLYADGHDRLHDDHVVGSCCRSTAVCDAYGCLC